MFLVILAALVAIALAGLATKYILEYRKSTAQITWREYAIGMAISPLTVILVVWIGWSVAQNNLMTFQEYWNGWENSAVKEFTQCSRDGPCRWEYECDPYLCSYECGGYEGSGDKRHYVSKTCWKTCWHDCPYVKQEYDFYVDTTLGRYIIATNMFPTNPQANRWRPSKQIPDHTISNAGTGEPSFWVEAHNRCLANQPGPVTARREYPNYVLASEHTLMKEHSGDIADYRAKNLLPPLTHTVRDFYHADKISFVSWHAPNPKIWQNALEYLNAGLGKQLHGDLHLVIVKSDFVSANPERYILALKAYWQDKTVFGNNALSKNAIVIVIGTNDGTTVSWSRAFTGMPLGNEKLIIVMRDGPKGLALLPDVLIWQSQRNGSKSVIQRILWGLDDPGTKFKRVSMSGKDGQGGFLYLKNEIQPTTGQMWTIFILTFLPCCAVWWWAAIHQDKSERKPEGWRRGRYTY